MVTRFDKGDVVRVRNEPGCSVVVLPSYCKPNPEDLPDDMPPIEVCCVPVALVRTETPTDSALRWVELHDLAKVDPTVNQSEPDHASLPVDALEKS